MKLVTYPYASPSKNASGYYGNTESLSHGWFPIGTNRFWHGGVHLVVPTSEPVRAIADGEIIAWRLNKTLPEYTPPGKKKGYPYSTGFVLIRHTFENNLIQGGVSTRQWKYYSLYMHLLHQPELTKLKQLPLFLVAKRQNISTKTYDPVTITQPAAGNAYKFCKIKHTASGQEGWVEAGAVDAKNRLRYPLEYVYDMNPTSGLDAAIKLDQVVTSSIPVNAGEIIGYGGTLAFQGSQPNMLHFEVFTDEAALMDFFANPTKDILGEVVLQEATTLHNKPQDDATRIEKAFPKKQKFYSVTPVDREGGINKALQYYRFHLTKDKNSPKYYGSQLIKFYSHADWRKHGWQSMQESGKFSQDGFCDNTVPLFNMLDKNHDNSIDLKEIRGAKRVLRRVSVKHPTEWSKAKNEIKYARLKTGEKGLPTLTGDSYTKFIEHVEQQQFWEKVPGLPPADAVWHLHPIGFVHYLRQSQCTLTGVPEEDFKTQVQETLRKTIDLLEKRKKHMVAWGAATQTSFKKWFGSDSAAARTTISTRIDKMLDLVRTRQHKDIQRAGFDKAQWIGYGSVFAYVRADDLKHQIFLGGDYHRAADTGTDSRVGVLLHEMSHFTSVGGTNDYKYGQDECLELARRNPSNALNNADSFEYYIEDGFNEV